MKFSLDYLTFAAIVCFHISRKSFTSRGTFIRLDRTVIFEVFELRFFTASNFQNIFTAYET